MNEFDGPVPERVSSGARPNLDDRIYVSCVRSTARLAAVLDSPDLMAAVVQDTCLRIAVQDWFGRPPSRRHRRARSRWNAEGAFRHREEQRLAEVLEQALGEAPGAEPEAY